MQIISNKIVQYFTYFKYLYNTIKLSLDENVLRGILEFCYILKLEKLHQHLNETYSLV